MTGECIISNNSCLDEKTGEKPKPGCGKQSPKIKLEGLKLYKIMPDDRGGRGETKSNEDKKVELSALKVLEILSTIGERDHFLLGFDYHKSPLKNLILTVLPLVPPQVRPSVSVDGGVIHQKDDLTYQ